VTGPGTIAAFLLAGVLLATACSSSGGSTKSAAVGSSATASTAGSCRSGSPGPGAQGGADVAVPGDIPDNQAYVTYHSSASYHIDVPEGWQRSQPAGAGGAVVFTDRFNAIHVSLTPAPTAPTVTSARSNEMPPVAASVSCFRAGKVSQVTRKSGPAVLVTYQADSSQDPVTGKVVLEDVERYEFWRSGTEAVITLSSPRGSDNVDPWRRVTDSFAWGA
jgi:hypothetical protein